jgi:branched-chain amino acid transport system permease protein
MKRSLKPSQALLALLLLSLALLPIASYLGLNAFYLDLAIRLMIFAIAATGLNLILGYGGLISLGHAAYLLIGAYSVAIPNYYDIDNGWAHLGLAIVCSALFALLTGAVSLRTRGAGFIMITLAFAQMIYFLFVSMETLGGSDGISISFTSDFGLFNLGDTLYLYYFTFVILLVFLRIIYRLNRSRFGYALTGSRLRPQRMHSLGYSPYRFQLIAYIISGVITGIAGFLLANFVQFITPEMMDWFRSAELIFMVALGGAATVAGPVFGAFIFVVLEHIMSEWTLYWHLPFGLILIAIAIFSKGGLVKLLDSHAARKPNA